MPPRLRAVLIYIFFFCATASFLPFITLYYESVGMSKQQIGTLIAALTLTGMIASPLSSALADAFKLHRYILPLAAFSSLIPMAALAQARSFPELLLFVILNALFVSPVIPLVDSAVLEILGEDRGAYGKLRLWGSVGFALIAWVIGLVIEWVGLEAMFVSFVFFMALCGLLTVGLPVQQVTSTEPYLLNLRRLFARWTFIGFLISVVLVSICHSILFNFMALYFKDLGAGEGLFGLGQALSGISELPVFFFSALLIHWLAPRGLLVIAFAAYALRALLVSVLTTPEAIVLTQAMHGLSFAALWAAGVVYISRITPPGLSATAQSILGIATFSIAGALGGWLGAGLYETFGPQTMYRIAALLAGLGLLLFLSVEFLGRRRLPVAEAPLA